MKKIIITIDGWSSCGKSTLAKQLAKELGYVYVDSGAMPCESDCRFMEAPPAVPPLKIFSVTYRPGRPRKDAPRPQPQDGEERIPLAWAIKGQRRY